MKRVRLRLVEGVPIASSLSPAGCAPRKPGGPAPGLRRSRRGIVVLLLLHLSGCTHWVTPKEVTPERYVAEKRPERIRVTLANGDRHVLVDPVVTADSVGGAVPVLVRGEWTASDSVWMVPRDQVRMFEANRANTLGTVALVATTVVVVGGTIAYLAAMSYLAD